MENGPGPDPGSDLSPGGLGSLLRSATAAPEQNGPAPPSARGDGTGGASHSRLHSHSSAVAILSLQRTISTDEREIQMLRDEIKGADATAPLSHVPTAFFKVSVFCVFVYTPIVALAFFSAETAQFQWEIDEAYRVSEEASIQSILGKLNEAERALLFNATVLDTIRDWDAANPYVRPELPAPLTYWDAYVYVGTTIT